MPQLLALRQVSASGRANLNTENAAPSVGAATIGLPGRKARSRNHSEITSSLSKILPQNPSPCMTFDNGIFHYAGREDLPAGSDEAGVE
jgi:hypothetical protein